VESSKRQGDHDARLESVEQRGDRIVVVLSWADREGARHQWAHALKPRGGKIIDMQDYANPARAAAATRLRALAG
jgi:hypothetical protein